jgi:tight adherence protein B
MVAAVVVFVLITGLILGGYYAVVQLPGVLAGRRLDQRLRDVSLPMGEAEPLASQQTVVKRRAEGPLPALDRFLAGSRFARLIEQSGLNTTPSTMVMISVLSAAVCAALAALFARIALAPALAAFVGLPLPTLFLMRKRTVRFRKFEEQFPEALDLLSRAIRAGHAFQNAMGMVAEEVGKPVGTEFKITFDQQNFGLPLRDALNELAERVAILDVRFFVTAVLIQRESGGNLAEILDNLSAVVRERFKIRRQIRVHTAHGRFTGYVLLALPAALGVALMFINPDLMRLLFEEHMGKMMLGGAVILQTCGFFWIRHVMNIEV